MTKAEVLLWLCLKNSQLGFKFRRQQSMGNFIVDFYCPKVGLVIELDGGVHGETEIIEKDKKKEKFLKENGLHLVRYTNDQLLTNLEKVLQEIKDYCIKHDTTPSPLLKEEGK